MNNKIETNTTYTKNLIYFLVSSIFFIIISLYFNFYLYNCNFSIF